MSMIYDSGDDFIESFESWITIGKHGTKSPGAQLDMLNAYKELFDRGAIKMRGNDQEEELEKASDYVNRKIRELQPSSQINNHISE